MKRIVAANWKLFYSHSQLTRLAHIRPPKHIEVIIAPPFPFIVETRRALPDFFLVAAQSVSEYNSGPFTGEVTAEMLKKCDCDTVIIGHSERRAYFNERNEDIKKRIDNALEYNLGIILCVGEKYEERSTRFSVVEEQLSVLEDGQSIIIAYEPIWCIGTGIIPRNEDITEMVLFIKEKGMKIGAECRVIYGGSVSSENIYLLNEIKELDGYLIGGASTNEEIFTIIQACDVDFSSGT